MADALVSGAKPFHMAFDTNPTKPKESPCSRGLFHLSRIRATDTRLQGDTGMRQSTRGNETIQAALEEQMVDAGIARYRKNWNAAQKRGDVADQQSVKPLVDYYTEQIADGISAAIKAATSGRGGCRNVTIGSLAAYKPEFLGYLTCRIVINSIIMRYPLTSTALELGKAIEYEGYMADLDAHNKGARKWVERELKRRKITSKQKKIGFYKKVSMHKGVKWEPWTTERRVQTGLALLHIFCETTRLAKLVIKNNDRRKKRELQVSPQILSWILSANEDLEIMTPFRIPMVIPPKPWTTLEDGGYLNTRFPIVTRRGYINDNKPNPKLQPLKGADMSKVYEALGHVDRTRFKINSRVLEVMRTYVDDCRGVGTLPAYEPVEVPVRPERANVDILVHKDWCKQARNAHDKNAATTMDKAQTTMLLKLADQFEEYEAIYFPHQIDFRGRVYALPVILHPQGPDHVRALLHFADGKSVTNDGAMWWLMIHGANCWGYDKCTMEERIMWVRDNAQMIADVAADPYTCTDWHKADKPWAFLAWCFDFIDVIEHGKPSYIRVAMDGSCNGLQHFSAMTRDPIGAKAVNLAANPKPADIYQTVADKVIEKLKAVPPEQKWMADTWLQIGVNRKLTKRSVMVMPYGGTLHSTMNYLEEEMDARLKGAANPFGDEKGKAVAFLATMVYGATREVVIGGKVVMDWLQTVARVVSEEGQHLQWTTPHGFVVKQNYRKYEDKEIKTYLNGRAGIRIQARVRIDGEEVHPKLSSNGISPNFVHSLDACALMTTVNAAAKKKVTHFHMIHDDYGTHAADTQVLADTLRKSFVSMYEKNDVLKNLRKEVLAQLPKERHADIPPVPKKGKFNLKEVLQSEFFFA